MKMKKADPSNEDPAFKTLDNQFFSFSNVILEEHHLGKYEGRM
jgi:hypothetical protein